MHGQLHDLGTLLGGAVGAHDKAILGVNVDQLRSLRNQKTSLFPVLAESDQGVFHTKKLIIGRRHEKKGVMTLKIQTNDFDYTNYNTSRLLTPSQVSKTVTSVIS
jgi:hypothetical protein